MTRSSVVMRVLERLRPRCKNRKCQVRMWFWRCPAHYRAHLTEALPDIIREFREVAKLSGSTTASNTASNPEEIA